MWKMSSANAKKSGKLLGQMQRRRLTGSADLVADYPIGAMQVSYANAMLDGS